MHDQTTALDALREQLPPGTVVRTILRHVSRSGMTRAISLSGPDYSDLDYLAARAGLGSIDNRYGGLRASGCGMDMGYHLVYSLSRMLYPNGHPCTGDPKTCHSNDHSNGDRDYTPGKLHRDGGYALGHRWL